jgi:acyl carrier protein
MDKTMIWNQVVATIRETFDTDAAITSNTVASDVDGWDSLSHMVLTLQMEQIFKITFPTQRAFRLKNVGELYALVCELVKTQ